MDNAGPAVWTGFAALQVVLGPLVGVSVGLFGGKLIAMLPVRLTHPRVTMS